MYIQSQYWTEISSSLPLLKSDKVFLKHRKYEPLLWIAESKFNDWWSLSIIKSWQRRRDQTLQVSLKVDALRSPFTYGNNNLNGFITSYGCPTWDSLRQFSEYQKALTPALYHFFKKGLPHFYGFATKIKQRSKNVKKHITLQNISLRSSFGLIHDATASQKNIKSCKRSQN